MRRVTQTIIDGPSGQPGNCLQAAVASLLGMRLDDVPHFVASPAWEISFMDFMSDRGKPVKLTVPCDDTTGIAVGPTIRGTHHAVVMVEGVVAWDPHPSRAGLTKILHVYATEPAH